MPHGKPKHPDEMSWDEILKRHPNLKGSGFKPNSRYDPRYNCVALAAGDEHRSWWPDNDPPQFWPDPDVNEETVEVFIAAFQKLGYSKCDSPDLEDGWQKVAIYAKDVIGEGVKPKHMAIQTLKGLWKSKLGNDKDIIHKSLSDLEDNRYGKVVQIMRKRV